LTEQGAKHVNRMSRFRGRTLSVDEASAALSDPAVHEHVVKEHVRRQVNRGEATGRVISGGATDMTIRQYAQQLPRGNNPLDLNQATVEFLNRPENQTLRQRMIDRLTALRDELNMPPDALSNAEIGQNPWEAALRLKEKADVSQAEPLVRRAAQDFVESLSRNIGDLKPDFILWDAATGTLTVYDPTHTVATRFEVFHEFKTMLYQRIFEALTGLPVRAIEFRSPREQRTL
jgi:hypothetical protein